jgi:hypothetical protein
MQAGTAPHPAVDIDIRYWRSAYVSGDVIPELRSLEWSCDLTRGAAHYKQYALLKWLFQRGCPMDLGDIATDAEKSGDLNHMKQVRGIFGPWPVRVLNRKLWWAALYNELDTVKWMHGQGAVWPKRFYDIVGSEPRTGCWSLECVQWAVANGSTWREWRCQDLAPQHYECKSRGAEHSDDTCSPCCRKSAREVFAWAHEHGCPCTC